VSGLVVLLADHDHLSGRPHAFEVERPPLLLIATAVVVVAVINSVSEELLWRQLLWHGCDGSRKAALVVGQTPSFGVAHCTGIHEGWLGMALAGVYSAVLSVLRITFCFRAALIAHLVTDHRRQRTSQMHGPELHIEAELDRNLYMRNTMNPEDGWRSSDVPARSLDDEGSAR
jgi:hypothetical protein